MKITEDKNKTKVKNKTGPAKDAGNNQWVSTGLKNTLDNRERRDGPGGEDAKKKSTKSR